MKKLLSSLVLMSLLVFIAGGSVKAQDRVTADIPFAFIVMNKVLPAGSYALGQYGPLPLLLIQESTSRKAACTLTTVVDNDPFKEFESKLVFRRYGEQYFLGQIWTGHVGRQVHKSNEELKVAKGSPEPRLIYVAAK